MLASRRNRGTRGVDDPLHDDGFYAHRRFHSNRRTGQPAGKRTQRRTLRAKEARAWRRAAERDDS